METQLQRTESETGGTMATVYYGNKDTLKI